VNGVSAIVAATSQTASGTKAWVVLAAVAVTAAFYLGAGWLARQHVERRVRAMMRDHPELAADLDDYLQQLRVRRSLRAWYRDEVRAQELSPPPRLAVDRKALPMLLALVTILVAALVAQAALGSALAGWVAFAGMPVVVVYGLSLLAPASRNRDRNHSS
jgi:Flp pilus assembly protein TadB